MHTFTLTQASDESPVYEHSGGRPAILVAGTFGSAQVKLQVKANGVGFIQLGDDDFNITAEDVLNVNIPAYCEYKVVAVGATGTTSLNVTIL